MLLSVQPLQVHILPAISESLGFLVGFLFARTNILGFPRTMLNLGRQRVLLKNIIVGGGDFNVFQLSERSRKVNAHLRSSYARFTSIMKLLLSSMSYIFEVHYHLLKKWDCLPLTTNNYLQPKNLFVFNRQNFGCLPFTICWGWGRNFTYLTVSISLGMLPPKLLHHVLWVSLGASHMCLDVPLFYRPANI